MNASYNFVADGFHCHTKKLCSRLSSSEVRFYTENGRFVLFSPLWAGAEGGYGSTYDFHLRLIGKRVVDFLLVLPVIELFLLDVTATAEALRANIDWKSAISLQGAQFDPKFQVEWVPPLRPPPTIFLLRKLG